MSRLRQTQSDFARLAAKLIEHIYSRGYEVTFGDAYRDPRLHGMMGVQRGYSRANSNHKARLSLDLNLFLNGEYLMQSDDHAEFGDWWEQQDPRCRWGGRFGDGNHYSFEWEGRQ